MNNLNSSSISSFFFSFLDFNEILQFTHSNKKFYSEVLTLFIHNNQFPVLYRNKSIFINEISETACNLIKSVKLYCNVPVKPLLFSSNLAAFTNLKELDILICFYEPEYNASLINVIGNVLGSRLSSLKFAFNSHVNLEDLKCFTNLKSLSLKFDTYSNQTHHLFYDVFGALLASKSTLEIASFHNLCAFHSCSMENYFSGYFLNFSQLKNVLLEFASIRSTHSPNKIHEKVNVSNTEKAYQKKQIKYWPMGIKLRYRTRYGWEPVWRYLWRSMKLLKEEKTEIATEILETLKQEHAFLDLVLSAKDQNEWIPACLELVSMLPNLKEVVLKPYFLLCLSAYIKHAQHKIDSFVNIAHVLIISLDGGNLSRLNDFQNLNSPLFPNLSELTVISPVSAKIDDNSLGCIRTLNCCISNLDIKDIPMYFHNIAKAFPALQTLILQEDWSANGLIIAESIVMKESFWLEAFKFFNNRLTSICFKTSSSFVYKQFNETLAKSKRIKILLPNLKQIIIERSYQNFLEIYI